LFGHVCIRRTLGSFNASLFSAGTAAAIRKERLRDAAMFRGGFGEREALNQSMSPAQAAAGDEEAPEQGRESQPEDDHERFVQEDRPSAMMKSPE